MGPSGCGKSTLLDALAGRLRSGVSQKGDILINGRRQKLSYGTSAYVTQDDVLMTTLTVREAFFALNGFPCPSLMNPSDHFLRTINKDFDNDIEEGLGGKRTTTADNIDALAASYKSSVHMEKVTRQIIDIRGIRGEVVKMEGQQPSFLTQSFVLTKRSFVNMYRDLGYYWLRFAIYIALCLCCGTIFYDIGHNYGSIQARGSMLMFVGAFLTFMAIGGFPSFVEDMKIFGRERLNGHYGVSSFVISNTVSATPYLLLISLVPGAIAYYLVGLQRSFDHFAYFSLGFYKNEFLGLTFPNNQAGGGDTITGDEILRDYWQVEMGYNKWVDLAVLFGMVILYRVLFLAIMKLTEKVKPMVNRLRFRRTQPSVHIADQGFEANGAKYQPLPTTLVLSYACPGRFREQAIKLNVLQQWWWHDGGVLRVATALVEGGVGCGPRATPSVARSGNNAGGGGIGGGWVGHRWLQRGRKLGCGDEGEDVGKVKIDGVGGVLAVCHRQARHEEQGRRDNVDVCGRLELRDDGKPYGATRSVHETNGRKRKTKPLVDHGLLQLQQATFLTDNATLAKGQQFKISSSLRVIGPSGRNYPT
uniref:ABC transporter G family member 11 n=1 Tax=Aegilops tauschii TaxID=37682 RepID=M8CFU8_AEGTA